MPTASDHCSWIRDRIDLYIDAELEGADREVFERHVETCAACGEELSLAKAVVSELRALPAQNCPDRVIDEAEARAGAVAVPGIAERLWDWLGGRVSQGLKPAMAAMVIVVAAATVFVLSQHEQSPFNRNNGDQSVTEDYSEKDMELAKLDAMLAFAYLGKYGRRTEEIVTQDVFATRVMKPLGKTIVAPMYPFPRDE